MPWMHSGAKKNTAGSSDVRKADRGKVAPASAITQGPKVEKAVRAVHPSRHQFACAVGSFCRPISSRAEVAFTPCAWKLRQSNKPAAFLACCVSSAGAPEIRYTAPLPTDGARTVGIDRRSIGAVTAVRCRQPMEHKRSAARWPAGCSTPARCAGSCPRQAAQKSAPARAHRARDRSH